MKTLKYSIVFSTLVMACGLAAASGASSDIVPKVLPVLVQVDSHGQVTGVSPSTELSPRLTRLLRANLEEMINAPATDKQGRATSSQFVINLALQSSPRAEGDYDVSFAYVSTTNVPSGSWYWVHTDGRQLALASQDTRNRENSLRIRADRPEYRPNRDQSKPDNSPSGPMPSAASIRVPDPKN